MDFLFRRHVAAPKHNFYMTCSVLLAKLYRKLPHVSDHNNIDPSGLVWTCYAFVPPPVLV